jgi:hypothetical protein
MSTNITISVDVAGAPGGTISLSLLQGTTLLKQMTSHGPFPFSLNVPLNQGLSYVLFLAGFTQGAFTIDITGAQTTKPAVPVRENPNSNVNDVIRFTV